MGPRVSAIGACRYARYSALMPANLTTLPPLLGLCGDALAEVGGRARKYLATQISKPSQALGAGEARIDLFVELVDDFGGRALWRDDAEPRARLVARQGIGHGRDVRQRRRSCRTGHRQRTQRASSDVLDCGSHGREINL